MAWLLVLLLVIQMNSSALDFAMNLTGTLSADKLGVTTTVKEQVENIEVPPP